MIDVVVFQTSCAVRIWFCDACRPLNEIIFEGSLVKVDSSAEITQGDIYLAKRNTGWKLLTCRENKIAKGYIVPMENAYPYNTRECYKVVEI